MFCVSCVGRLYFCSTSSMALGPSHQSKLCLLSEMFVFVAEKEKKIEQTPVSSLGFGLNGVLIRLSLNPSYERIKMDPRAPKALH